jgi:hypothetical protein
VPNLHLGNGLQNDTPSRQNDFTLNTRSGDEKLSRFQLRAAAAEFSKFKFYGISRRLFLSKFLVEKSENIDFSRRFGCLLRRRERKHRVPFYRFPKGITFAFIKFRKLILLSFLFVAIKNSKFLELKNALITNLF